MGLRCWTLTSSSTCCQWCSLDKCFWTSNSFLCSSLRNSDTSWSEKKKIHSREERNVLTNEQKQILCHPWRCFTNAGQVKKGNTSELWIIRHIFLSSPNWQRFLSITYYFVFCIFMTISAETHRKVNKNLQEHIQLEMRWGCFKPPRKMRIQVIVIIHLFHHLLWFLHR